MGQTKAMSTCHPAVLVYSRGLCMPCYRKAAKLNQLESYPKRVRHEKSLSICHPDKISYVDDLCRKCYGRKQNLSRYNGLTLADYDLFLKEQKGCCAICYGNNHSVEDVLYVDHNHDTNLVRGLLCNRCNSGIGMLSDDPNLILSAMRYLTK